MDKNSSIKPVEWRDGQLVLLDQRRLPGEEFYLACSQATEVAQAIREMVVRGAPAIGIAAAYGVVLAACVRWSENPARWRAAIEEDLQLLAASRPTAVNLFWALNRMQRVLDAVEDEPFESLLREAQQIHAEDFAANLRMGEAGAALLEPGSRVLTHCNTGALATGGYGTALGVIRAAFVSGKLAAIFADETRPWLQGSRLTAWELQRDGIPVTLLCEGAAASLFRIQKINWVIVGADRIAANGDVVNKIGTYSLAILARQHGARLMVVAPLSTVDLGIACGDDIKIEFRGAAELLDIQGYAVGTRNIDVWNPVFDLTPAEWVDVLVTEKGVIHRPDRESIAALYADES